MIWATLVGGLVGTIVLTTILRAAGELGLTRMDVPFLLGTALTSDRVRAKVVGYALHFAFGLLFALAYFVVFEAVDRSGVVLGALLGLMHGLFAGTALVNLLLPLLHPRMGSGMDDARSAPLLERPGFLLLNYGRQTPVVTIAAHVVYGALVGAFASLA